MDTGSEWQIVGAVFVPSHRSGATVRAAPTTVMRVLECIRRLRPTSMSARAGVAGICAVAAVMALAPGAVGPASAAPPRPALSMCGTDITGSSDLLGSSGSSQGSAGSHRSGPGRTEFRTVRVDNRNRTFRVHFPSGYSGRARTPLILAFHGHAERSAAFERYSGLSRLPAIVVYPDGSRGTDGGSAWQGAPYSSKADDVAFTRAILATMHRTACVDGSRVYAVGRSNGAALVEILSCRMPGSFAAFATVSAAVYQRALNGCRSRTPVSLIDFHGTDDPVINYRGGVKHGERYLSSAQWIGRWAARDRCAGPVSMRLSPTVERTSRPICANGTRVVHYRIAGGTHRWPASVAPATRIWEFFATARR